MGCLFSYFTKTREIQLISLRCVQIKPPRCDFCGTCANNPMYMTSIKKTFCGITCWEVWHRKEARRLDKTRKD